LAAPVAPEPIADQTAALEPSAMADPIPVEQPAPTPEPQVAAATPKAANEPGPPPAKVAVG
jgi:hypothetical protein